MSESYNLFEDLDKLGSEIAEVHYSATANSTAIAHRNQAIQLHSAAISAIAHGQCSGTFAGATAVEQRQADLKMLINLSRSALAKFHKAKS